MSEYAGYHEGSSSAFSIDCLLGSNQSGDLPEEEYYVTHHNKPCREQHYYYRTNGGLPATATTSTDTAATLELSSSPESYTHSACGYGSGNSTRGMQQDSQMYYSGNRVLQRRRCRTELSRRWSCPIQGCNRRYEEWRRYVDDTPGLPITLYYGIYECRTRTRSFIK